MLWSLITNKKGDKYMDEKNKAISVGLSRLIILFVVLLCCFVGLWIMFDYDRPTYYTILPLLPFSYGIMSLLFQRVYKYIFNNLAVCIVVGLYFIRNVFTPFIMSLDNYYGVIHIRSEESVIYAILLMIFETFFIFLTLYFQCGKIKNTNKSINKRITTTIGTNVSNVRIFGFMMLLMTLMMVYTWINVPEVRLNYTNIFADNAATLSIDLTEDIVPRGTLKRALYTLSHMFFSFSRIFIPASFIYLIRKKMRYKRFAIILSFLIIITQLLFISSETMYVFVVMTVLFSLLLKLYPSNRKMILSLTGFGTGICLLLIIIGKIDSSTELGLMSKYFQAYFPGICNIAGIFNIINPNKLATLFFDFYSAVPFRNTLFGVVNGDRLVLVYTASNNVRGQIIPCVGQAFHYIGVFAPIVLIILVRLAFKYERKRQNEKNIWKYTTYTLIIIYAAATPILYNVTIFLRFYTCTMLPMLILSHYSSYAFNIDRLQNYEAIRKIRC